MNLPPPKNKVWKKVDRTHVAFGDHVKRYPYLGRVGEGGHYYVYHDNIVQGVVVVMPDPANLSWEIGCSFEPDYRGKSAQNACQNWLTRYKINYNPLSIRCLVEHKPVQYFATQLGFIRQSVINGWVIYKFPTEQ